jgi:hypothetical protein
MSFAEILDAELGCTNVPPVVQVWNARPVTAPLFAFELPLTAARPAPTPVPARAEAPPPVRLSTLERQTLDDARTPDALRRAYRTLARRYHPDHHHGSNAAERERLARLFAEATEHYRLLRASGFGLPASGT